MQPFTKNQNALISKMKKGAKVRRFLNEMYLHEGEESTKINAKTFDSLAEKGAIRLKKGSYTDWELCI